MLHLETAIVDLDEVYTKEHPPVQPGRYVMLAVSDTGSGIDKSILPRIFDPFFTTKEVGKGTGLGLSIVYGIVKQSGGYIWVYSEPGHGTTFKLYFPVVAAPLENPVARYEASHRPVGQTVLVVEDEAMIRSKVRECLQQLGYQVLEAESGEVALQTCDGLHGKMDLVLTDLVMPGMGGHELAGELAERHPGMRMLFMSGYTEDSAARREILLRVARFCKSRSAWRTYPWQFIRRWHCRPFPPDRRLQRRSPALSVDVCSRLGSMAMDTLFLSEQICPGIIQVVPAITFQPLSLGVWHVQNAVALGAHHFSS